MRRFLTTLTALTTAAALLAPSAGAQDIFDDGRLGGGSAQLLPVGSSTSANQLSEVGDAVDLQRYAGKWYQVAALPQPYTLQCARDTTAEYEVLDASTISVRNTCGTLPGQDSVIAGTATVRSGASLRVNFPDVPFQDPNGPANYRITYLAEDYSLAIVGDPNRNSGFVLSRTPDLNTRQWSQVRSIVEARGWWSCAFLTVPTADGRRDVAPLCTQ